MIARLHKDRDGKIVLALCDKELIGKKLSEGNSQLDLSSDFYKGEEKSEEEAGDLLRNAWTCNIVGERSIQLAVKEEVITKGNVKKVQGVPYAISITF